MKFKRIIGGCMIVVPICAALLGMGAGMQQEWGGWWFFFPIGVVGGLVVVFSWVIVAMNLVDDN